MHKLGVNVQKRMLFFVNYLRNSIKIRYFAPA